MDYYEELEHYDSDRWEAAREVAEAQYDRIREDVVDYLNEMDIDARYEYLTNCAGPAPEDWEESEEYQELIDEETRVYIENM